MVLIADYLQDFVRVTNKGTCNACGKSVQWSKEKLGGHKRANCPQASEEEKLLFHQLNRQPTPSISTSTLKKHKISLTSSTFR